MNLIDFFKKEFRFLKEYLKKHPKQEAVKTINKPMDAVTSATPYN